MITRAGALATHAATLNRYLALPSAVPELIAALDFLIAQPQLDTARAGAIGFCMGGGVAIALARRDSRFRAIAPFYGTNPRPLEVLRLLCPVVGSYPSKEFTARSGRKLEAQLATTGVTHDILGSPGVRHSFFNDQSRAYNEPAASDASRRTLDFFAEHVRSSEVPA